MSSQRICHSAQDAVLNPIGSFLQVSSAGNEKSIQTPLCCFVYVKPEQVTIITSLSRFLECEVSIYNSTNRPNYFPFQ